MVSVKFSSIVVGNVLLCYSVTFGEEHEGRRVRGLVGRWGWEGGVVDRGRLGVFSISTRLSTIFNGRKAPRHGTTRSETGTFFAKRVVRRTEGGTGVARTRLTRGVKAGGSCVSHIRAKGARPGISAFCHVTSTLKLGIRLAPTV